MSWSFAGTLAACAETAAKHGLNAVFWLDNTTLLYTDYEESSCRFDN